MPIYSDIPFIGPANVTSATAAKYGITFHNTSNSRLASASDEASYAKRRTDAGAHYYVDKTQVIQALNTDLGAGHAGSSWPNRHCIAYEITGWNSFSHDRWLSDVAWNLLARQVKRDCERWDIPMRWLTVDQLKRGERGFSTHDDCRRAFGGTSHTDPGPNFPKDHLIALLKGTAIEEDDMPTPKELWHTDGLIDAPTDAPDRKTNPYWAPASALRGTLERVYHLPQELAAIKAGNAAVLAAVKGLDTKAVLAAIDKASAADVARDAALLEELRGLASGGATADQIVDALALRLTKG